MLRSEEERVADARKDEEARKKHWGDLIAQLRALNPTQKFKYRGGSEVVRHLIIDGVELELRLDEQYKRESRYNPKPSGIYYFTIGRGSFRGGPRPRAKLCKTGFDWARIAQLVEYERKYLVARVDGEAQQKATIAKANAELDALFKRRPDLEDRRYELNISSRDGRFTFTVHGMDVDKLERALDLAKVDEGDGQ